MDKKILNAVKKALNIQGLEVATIQAVMKELKGDNAKAKSAKKEYQVKYLTDTKKNAKNSVEAIDIKKLLNIVSYSVGEFETIKAFNKGERKTLPALTKNLLEKINNGETLTLNKKELSKMKEATKWEPINY